MGRAKIAMEFITKEKARNVTYAKRKKGLLKKGHEFAILCNVPVCIIIYPYKDGKQLDEPEVYTFKGNGSPSKDPETAREIIERYLSVPTDERTKRALTLSDMFDEWKRKADQELSKLRQKNVVSKYPNYLTTFIDHFTPDQLMEMLLRLDQKIGYVNQRMDMIRGDNGSGLVLGGIGPATSVSGFMVHPGNNHNSNQFGGIDNGEVINQFPMFGNNYAVFSGSMQQEGHGFGYYNDLNPCPDQKGQVGSEHGGGVNNNTGLYSYNGMMNMGYYDQGSGSDSVGYSATGMPAVSVPLQFPLLPGQCHQMFYE